MIPEKTLLFLHPGAEWYGADKILFNTVQAVRDEWRCVVCLPEPGILKEKLEAVGIQVHIVPFPALRRQYFTPAGLVRFVAEFCRTLPGLLRLCRRERVRLVHANTLAVVHGLVLKALLRIPHVWHVHEIILRPRGFTTLMRWAANLGADRVVAVSDAVGQAFGAKRTSRIYNGIEPYRRSGPGRTSPPWTVGMLGRFNSWKGQLDLLRAAELLHERGHVPSLIDAFVFCGGVYAGDTRHLDAFRAHLEASPVRDRVRIMDFREDVQPVYEALDVFVLPSTSPDPFPTVVLEAMSLSLPVAAYRHGGVVEMLGPQGAFAEPCSVEGLADAILRVAEDSGKREDAGLLSSRRFELFSARRFEEAFRECYRQVAVGVLPTAEPLASE